MGRGGGAGLVQILPYSLHINFWPVYQKNTRRIVHTQEGTSLKEGDGDVRSVLFLPYLLVF